MAIWNWLSGGKTRNLPEKEIEKPAPSLENNETQKILKFQNIFSKSLPSGDFRFIAVDVETACSDQGSICQIGLACVNYENEIQTYSVLINPNTDFDDFNIKLHGISPKAVQFAPAFGTVFRELKPLLERHRLVQHSNFDKQSVTAACRLSRMPVPNFDWHDSVLIARRAWPELKNNGGHGLANLKSILRLEFNHHDAGEDARAAAMVVLHAEQHLGSTFDNLFLSKKDKIPSHPRIKEKIFDRRTFEPNANGLYFGKSVVFTGNLSIPRGEAAKLAAQVGMDVRGSVSKKVEYLIVGDQDLTLLAGYSKSSKHRRAEELQALGCEIQIIGESEFLKMISSGLS